MEFRAMDKKPSDNYSHLLGDANLTYCVKFLKDKERYMVKKILLCIFFILVFSFTSPAFAEELSKEIQVDDIKTVKNMILTVMARYDGVYLKTTDEYRVVVEKEYPDGFAAFLTMNLHTLRKPVFRLNFDIMPLSESTVIKLRPYNVVNPDSNREELYPMTNKDDLATIHQMLNQIGYEAQKYEIQKRIAKEYESTERKDPVIAVDLGWKLEGDRVVSVEENSIAYKAGLRTGDAILRINDIDIESYKHTSINQVVSLRYETNLITTLECMDLSGEHKTVTIGSEIAIKNGPYLP